ncbi:unnamed protein product [Didymodactylos carnosus]|uniref:Ubiquitin carboxyl-terminal hydrolase n=1 Tax=Didymodactylos carnosus TaxID=1234261 RepID=A0A8S2DXW5_9BILA|nr:unnamed protein product [Didymodactylos carnosus]CAF3764603.1 unnamed protein product [Didymodactylos carnosus]
MSDGGYYLKVIPFRDVKIPILLQNQNGPCSLIAIMNVLLLKRHIHINHQQTSFISAKTVLEYLANYLFEQQQQQKRSEDDYDANYAQNVNDALNVLRHMDTGLNVNVRFNGIQKFEFTRECAIFDLLNIELMHGWLIDPVKERELYDLIGDKGYNEVIERYRCPLTERFRRENPTQLTDYGLKRLEETLKDNQLVVLFHNNHFSTLYKFNHRLFLLVTDQGFIDQTNVVWETLDNTRGNSLMCDGQFRNYRERVQLQRNEEQDEQLALALQQQEGYHYNDRHYQQRYYNTKNYYDDQMESSCCILL